MKTLLPNLPATSEYRRGQRWISQMEPELGLGIVTKVDRRIVEIHFPACDCIRRYAVSSAPLKRVEFTIGDVVTFRGGRSFKVVSTSVVDGLITYHGEGGDFPESEMSDQTSFTTPQTRLLNGSSDHIKDFQLRYRSLAFQHNSRKSNVRGFLGGRIDLIPHQLYVAHEIASRAVPRALLSDETGLGKTIEACLVLHRLLISGRISRALILVPPSLVHQWFIELFRRFNLNFRIFNQSFCRAVTEKNADANPFLEDQLGICAVDFLASEEKWKNAAGAAGWDMLVIDEAHHLTQDSPAYHMAQELSLVSRGLLLLTATPEQLGHRHHFARLVLLDPARYHDFTLFEQEEAHYSEITALVETIFSRAELAVEEKELLRRSLPERFAKGGADGANPFKFDNDLNRQIIQELLDRHGTGRAVFRNTRATMTGFPQRVAHLYPLPADANDPMSEGMTDGFDSHQRGRALDFYHDPRLIWLAQFLTENKRRKVLLICSSMEKVRAIENALRRRIQVELALFHENQTLLQRDRFAAWFAREDGAQILLCSEIGSEGRNFQFAHHLVLFDLPPDPELLEQRIGRLDRIGQTETIHIHVPFLAGSGDEQLARWYHEGLNAFEKNVSGVYQIYQEFGDKVSECISGNNLAQLENLIAQTRKRCAEIARTLAGGRDRLLQMHSYQPQIAEKIITEIKAVEAKQNLEKYMLEVFEIFGIQTQTISKRTYHLNLLALTTADFPLPPMREDEFTVTFDRKTAIVHEDIEFLTWDHPMVMGVMELVLGSEKGNCALAVWLDESTDEILLEAVFVLESVAPKSLYVDRFLPPRPIRVVVNHEYADRGKACSVSQLAASLQPAYDMPMLRHPRFKQELFPRMLAACTESAEKQVSEIISSSLHIMESTLSGEVNRLKELRRVNSSISKADIDACGLEMDALRRAIQSARLRLDSLRLISRGEGAELII